MSMTIFEIADATARIDTISQWGLIFSEVAVKKLFNFTRCLLNLWLDYLIMSQSAQHGCMLVAPASTEQAGANSWLDFFSMQNFENMDAIL